MILFSSQTLANLAFTATSANFFVLQILCDGGQLPQNHTQSALQSLIASRVNNSLVVCQQWAENLG